MPRSRHKRVKPRRIRKIAWLALPVAIGVPVGVTALPDPVDDPPAIASITGMSENQREVPLSRGSGQRATEPPVTRTPSETPTPTETPEPEETESEDPEETEEPEPTKTSEPEPEPTVAGHMFTTANINVRTGPGQDEDVVTVLARGTEVDVTGKTDGEWVQIIHSGTTAWVSGDYLSENEPKPEETEEPDNGISYAECPSGSSVESGLTPDAIRVHRAVCAEFPGVDSYGGVRSGGGEHSTGHALDIMTSSRSLGDSIAEWVRAHHKELGVSEVIWAQRIWTVERSSEGWRWMEDRGSATANHYDHVHVTVYGNAGG